MSIEARFSIARSKDFSLDIRLTIGKRKPGIFPLLPDQPPEHPVQQDGFHIHQAFRLHVVGRIRLHDNLTLLTLHPLYIDPRKGEVGGTAQRKVAQANTATFALRVLSF